MPHGFDSYSDSEAEQIQDLADDAVFMSLHCPESLKDYQFCGSEHSLAQSFAALLTKSTHLHELLKAARKSNDYDSFWSLCEQRIVTLSRPFTGPSGISTLKLPTDISAGTSQLLGEIRPNLTKLIRGDITLPSWPPPISKKNSAAGDDESGDPAVSEGGKLTATLGDGISRDEEEGDTAVDVSCRSDTLAHIESLKLSAKGSMPILEVHDLGGFKMEPLLNSRINHIFDIGAHTFLVNVSGSGKTRLLYEGLCQHWGFYFTARVDTVGLGSVDVQAACARTQSKLVFLPPSQSLAYQPHLAMNIQSIARSLNEVLLARLLVFRLFIEIIHELGEGPTEDHKRRWLIIQIYPSNLYHRDIFGTLAEYFEYAEPSYIERTIKQTLADINALWATLSDTSLHLHIALDEANSVSRKNLSHLEDENGEYPLLKEVLCTWRESLGDCVTFVAAGVDIPKEYFVRDRWMNTFRWSSDTGGFCDRETQRRYVLRFLPSGMAESQSGQVLLSRIWDWCRGRHRLTSLLVAVFLKNWFRSPHKLSLDYIWSLTGHRVTVDENGLAERENPSNWTTSLNYAAYTDLFDVLLDDISMQAAVHEALFHYLITCEHARYFDEDRTDVVSHGIGRFVGPDMRKVAVDEPLFLVAAARWFYKEGRSLTNFQDFVKLFQSPSTRPYNPVGYICTYLSLALDGKRPLSALLNFPRDDVPPWATKPAQLVRLYTGSDGEVHHEPVHTLDMFSGPTLGFNARTRNDLHTWLTSASGAPFCVCSTSCNADLIFVLELSNHKLIWVVLRTSGSGTADVVTPEELQESLDSLLPINLFPAQFNSKSFWVPYLRLETDMNPIKLKIVNSIPTTDGTLSSDASQWLREIYAITSEQVSPCILTSDTDQQNMIPAESDETFLTAPWHRFPVRRDPLPEEPRTADKIPDILISTGLLRQIDGKIRSVVNGEAPLLPAWTPNGPNIRRWDHDVVQYLTNLRVPEVQSKPSLLLHNLGLFDALEDGQQKPELIKALFSQDIHQDVLFVNTPGSGKTRLLFDGLCVKWGIYFICKQDTSGLGSSDLFFTITESIRKSEGFVEELPRKKKKTKKTPSTSRHTRKIEGARFKAILKKRLDRNREIASSRFNEVLLARLLIFAQFITAVTEAGKDIQSMKQVWLLLQLFPAKIRPDGNVASQDIFTQLALQLSRASPSDVHGTITWILEWCRRKIGVTTSNSFFCVVDEAPFASSKYNKAFRSASGTLPRPVLRELMFAWANYNVSNVTLRFILTGTGINADIVDEAIRSAIGKMAPVHRIRATGAFDENTQRAYLEYYCPQIFMDPHSTSLAVELLRKRMWYWLRGRHRFTASFVEVLLTHGMERPNFLLSEFIRIFTRPKSIQTTSPIPEASGFIVTDAERIIEEEIRMWPKFEMKIDASGFNFETLTTTSGLTRTVIELAYTRLMRSGHAYNIEETKQAQMVAIGVARFLDSTPGAQAVCDEPLAYLALDCWVRADPIRRLKYLKYVKKNRCDGSWTREEPNPYIHHYLQHNHGYHNFLASHIAHMFSTWRRLDEVFTLHPDWVCKDLLDKKARLVVNYGDYYDKSIWGPTSGTVSFGFRGTSSGSSTVLGVNATSPEQVSDWLQSKSRAPFCFPVDGMGPDILFSLEVQTMVTNQLNPDLALHPDSYKNPCILIAMKINDDESPFGSSAEKLDYLLRSVTPAHFYNTDSAQPPTGMPQLQSSHEVNLQRRRLQFNESYHDWKYPLMRVLATPARIDLSRANSMAKGPEQLTLLDFDVVERVFGAHDPVALPDKSSMKRVAPACDSAGSDSDASCDSADSDSDAFSSDDEPPAKKHKA